ncbi:hypothetical protein K7432_003767 [Basidiobolus ranarum]|uniref:PH domain-containing protein n=1 Tax=Basidiobolus ranarum TaxID=34480 RepID=A0ABR2W5Q1_9FUNG
MSAVVESATQINLPVSSDEVTDVPVEAVAVEHAEVDTNTVPEPELLEAKAEAPQKPEELTATEAIPEQQAVNAEEEVIAEQQVVNEEVITPIQQGYLQKRGLKPLRLWKNRYFGLHPEPFALAQLRLVSKKSLKATSAPREEFERVNKALFHNIASATVSGEGLLFYFKSSHADHVEVPLGIINLEDVQSVAPAKASKPHAFCIKTNARDYILGAPNSEEAKSWVHTIQGKLDSLSTLSNVTDTVQYKDTYEKLVTRQAFNAKSASIIPTGILSDSEVLSGSDNEKENENENEASAVAKDAEVVESQAEEVPEEPEAVVAEDSAVEDAPKRKSVFDGFKSFIKKSDSNIEIAAVVEASAEAQEITEAEAAEETSAEQPAEVAEATNSPVAKAEEVDVDNKPSRPLSFGLPKFLKSQKKAEVAEAQVELGSSEDIAPQDVLEPQETEVGAATTEEVPVEESAEVSSDAVPNSAPESPVKRSFSNLFRSKKSKNSESQVASVEEVSEVVAISEPQPEVAVESTAEVEEAPKSTDEPTEAAAEEEPKLLRLVPLKTKPSSPPYSRE